MREEHTYIDHLWAVIPAGGSGTRLWPLSRAARPKFLLPLLGSRSLIQQTFDRVSTLTPPDQIVVVCGPAHAAAIASEPGSSPVGGGVSADTEVTAGPGSQHDCRGGHEPTRGACAAGGICAMIASSGRQSWSYPC